MAYADNRMKFTCVLNPSRPIPQLLNALAHSVAGMVSCLPSGAGDFLNYTNDADKFAATISRYPFIILKSKNGSQLATLRAAASDAGILHNVFVSTMLGSSAEDQMTKTKSAAATELEYWAVTIFGDAAVTGPLTKKFSVFSISDQAGGG
jgi:hypothetical protein